MGIDHNCECSACVELHQKVAAVVKDLREARDVYEAFGRPVEPSRVVEIYERIARSLEK